MIFIVKIISILLVSKCCSVAFVTACLLDGHWQLRALFWSDAWIVYGFPPVRPDTTRLFVAFLKRLSLCNVSYKIKFVNKENTKFQNFILLPFLSNIVICNRFNFNQPPPIISTSNQFITFCNNVANCWTIKTNQFNKNY